MCFVWTYDLSCSSAYLQSTHSLQIETNCIPLIVLISIGRRGVAYNQDLTDKTPEEEATAGFQSVHDELDG